MSHVVGDSSKEFVDLSLEVDAGGVTSPGDLTLLVDETAVGDTGNLPV